MAVSFSRASPSKEYRCETEFDPQTLVDGEACTPFRIKGGGKDSEVPPLVGYYRQSDKLILLLDDKTRRYVAASEHPVVKAGKRNPSGIHLFPIQLASINSEKVKFPKLEPPL
ncbi:hypothetical protein [Haloferula sp.]|uniref:hypothetical protein n=1 Tax=Haloferula sp. TaxID=2497595 RepID=UPI003C74D8CF